MYDPYVHLRNMQQKDRILTVTGIGEVTTDPNTAMIHLSVRTENIKLTAAQQENAETMTQVIQSLQHLGVPDDYIQTIAFTIDPRYDYVEGKQIFRGYEVVNTISVKLTNFQTIGQVIDIAVENGVNEVGNIAFSHSNREPFQQKALQLALQNARNKAQAMADSLQIQFDLTPIKITEKANGESSSFKTFMLAEQSTTTPIEPGQLIITATVRVQYKY